MKCDIFFFDVTYDKFLYSFFENIASVVQLYICATTQMIQMYWTSVSWTISCAWQNAVLWTYSFKQLQSNNKIQQGMKTAFSSLIFCLYTLVVWSWAGSLDKYVWQENVLTHSFLLSFISSSTAHGTQAIVNIIFNEELSSEISKLHMQLDLLVALSVMHWDCIPYLEYVSLICKVHSKASFIWQVCRESGGGVLIVLGSRVQSWQTENSIFSSFTLFLSKLIAWL